MKKPKSRMSEVLDLARQGKNMECANKAVEAFNVYTKRISKAIGQYPAQDGAFIVAGLRHIANSIEANDEQTKRWAAVLERTIKAPPVPIETHTSKKGPFGLW